MKKRNRKLWLIKKAGYSKFNFAWGHLGEALLFRAEAGLLAFQELVVGALRVGGQSRSSYNLCELSVIPPVLRSFR